MTNSMQLLHYFAYGSNLHPRRLSERVPSAKLIGTASLTGHSIYFHKRGQDDSGKCNLVHTGEPVDLVHGAIYSIELSHKSLLDQFEGAGYDTYEITVLHASTQYDCFVYLAQQTHIDNNLLPYHWYRELVIQGARYLDFPEEYVKQLAKVNTVDDPDPERQSQHAQLLHKMKTE